MDKPQVVCFGELLIRINAPGVEPLMQSPTFDWHVGGAEANVAAGLAQLGVGARMLTTVSDNPLGEAAIGQLRRYGIDTRLIQRAEGRVGLYFYAPGAGQRQGVVTYDRQHSCFANAAVDNYDPAACLADADWVHISGVTPAVGANAAEAACQLAEAAADAGIPVSYDFNHREKMWAAWGGDAQSYILRLANTATLLFANDHDLGRIVELKDQERGRSLEQAFAAFEKYERLQCIASAFRTTHSAHHHSLTASLITRDGAYHAGPADMPLVIDRIGGGDAFAAGVIASKLSGHSPQERIDYGLAASVHKHTIPGDFPHAQWRDLDAIKDPQGADVSR